MRLTSYSHCNCWPLVLFRAIAGGLNRPVALGDDDSGLKHVDDSRLRFSRLFGRDYTAYVCVHVVRKPLLWDIGVGPAWYAGILWADLSKRCSPTACFWSRFVLSGSLKLFKRWFCVLFWVEPFPYCTSYSQGQILVCSPIEPLSKCVLGQDSCSASRLRTLHPFFERSLSLGDHKAQC